MRVDGAKLLNQANRDNYPDAIAVVDSIAFAASI
jgi:hypothetical protein